MLVLAGACCKRAASGPWEGVVDDNRVRAIAQLSANVTRGSLLPFACGSGEMILGLGLPPGTAEPVAVVLVDEGGERRVMTAQNREVILPHGFPASWFALDERYQLRLVYADGAVSDWQAIHLEDSTRWFWPVGSILVGLLLAGLVRGAIRRYLEG